MRLAFAACLLLLGSLNSALAQGPTAVIANRTGGPVTFSAGIVGLKPAEHRLAVGDNLSLPLAASGRLSLGGKRPRTYTIEPGTAYLLLARASGIELEAIGLEQGLKEPPIILPAPDHRQSETRRGPYVLRVRIMVDDDERAAQAVWEKRLRGRVADASAILERDCGVRLEVVAVGTWITDNGVQDFPRSLDEFRQQVALGNERLVIGFTSQYALTRGRTHLGGIHGPLSTHLLVREWSQIITEPERLEVLLHELGHFFGAAHSPEANSVMRPVLADRKARAAAFRIGLDPLNTLAATLVAEQLRHSDCRDLGELALPLGLQLRPLYFDLARAMRDDPNPARYVGLLDHGRIGRVAVATRALIAARQNAAAHDGSTDLAQGEAVTDSPAERLKSAALLAEKLPADCRLEASLLCAALSGPEQKMLAGHALARPLVAQVGVSGSDSVAAQPQSSVEARRERVLASAALACVVGPQLAEAAALSDTGLADPTAEQVDLNQYADRLLGVALVSGHVERGAFPEHLVEAFESDGLLPKSALADRLPRRDFERQYGNLSDARFEQLRAEVWRRAAGLVHRPARAQ